MNSDSSEPYRLFPRGLISLAVATMLERCGYFMVLSSLMMFIHGGLRFSSSDIWTTYMLGVATSSILGGLLGDAVGHRRIAILGAALTGGALMLLSFPLEVLNESAFVPVLIILFVLASGRGMFPINVPALAASLYDGRRSRVPLAGGMVVLQTGVALGALLGPLFAEGIRFLGEELFELGWEGSFHLAAGTAGQLALGAMVVLLARRGPLSAAENDLKGAIRAGHRISDFAGAARQSARALPFLIPGWALFMLGYNLSYGSVHGFTSLFCGERIDWLWSIGPVSAVLLAPLAVLLVCLVVRSRERIRHTSLAAAGMLAAAAAVAVLLVGSLLAAGPVSDAAPSWHSETPSLAWPIGAVLLLGVADLVAVPLFHAFVLAASPRRVRGLMLGLTIAAVGHFAFLDRFFYDWLEVIAFTWRTASVCAALLLTALLVFAVGKAHRRP